MPFGAPDCGKDHKGKSPGPDATYDEYLRYVLDKIQENRQLLSEAVAHGRHGTVQVYVRINALGVIAEVRVSHSSGYADLDEQALQMVKRIGQLEPPPRHLLKQIVHHPSTVKNAFLANPSEAEEVEYGLEGLASIPIPDPKQD